VSVRYIELADYLAIAAEITRLDTPTLIRVTKVDLAESALHAPAASFGETEFYPDFIDKAAVLIVHLAKNHPLPDGNKRAAWVALRLFIEINDWTWNTTPAVDDAERQCSPSPPAHGAKTMPALGCGATLHRHQLAHIRTKGRHLVDRQDSSVWLSGSSSDSASVLYSA